MNTDFRQLMARPVIRLEDVSALRAHIESRHPEHDSQLRAELMAEGINRMLDSALTGLEPEVREGIRKKLISEHLIAGRQSILKMDVLNRVLALDMKPDQLLAKTWGWYVLNTGHSVPLTDFMEQVSPYLPHRVREAIRDAEDRAQSYQATARRQEPSAGAALSRTPSGGFSAAEAFGRLKAYRLTPRGRRVVIASVCLVAVAAALPALLKPAPLAPAGEHGAHVTSAVFAPPKEYRPALSPARLDNALEKPGYLKYRNISIERLKEYLARKDSMLLTADYLDQLLSYSLEKDLNPLLLIAIIGQEQNYVPQGHRYANRIIENPFNIYGSWETHPVGFTASMKEACYTINLALSERPPYVDPFVLINGRYAEDPHWYLGVKVIFRDLMAVAGE